MASIDLDNLPPLRMPRQSIPGVPQWNSGLPTNEELVATLAVYPRLCALLDDAERALAEAEANVPGDIPKFVNPGADIGSYFDVYVAWHQSLTEDQRNALAATSEAGKVRNDLRTMVTLTRSHEIIDGVALLITESTAYFHTIQIRSNATDVRKFIEAREIAPGGEWEVELGDLDVAPGDRESVRLTSKDEVRQVGLAHILAGAPASASAEIDYDDAGAVHADLNRLLAHDSMVHRIALYTDGTIDIMLKDGYQKDPSYAEQINAFITIHGYRGTVTTILGRTDSIHEVRLSWPYRNA